MVQHLFKRIQYAKQNLKPVDPKYRIVWEDPLTDEPAKVTVPSANWLAMALAGGYLPPIGAYLLDREEPDEAPKRHPYAEPIGPMTEEQAMEYLALQVLPRHVIEYQGNRQIIKIVSVEMVPSDRTFRNAWIISQEDGFSL